MSAEHVLHAEITSKAISRTGVDQSGRTAWYYHSDLLPTDLSKNKAVILQPSTVNWILSSDKIDILVPLFYNYYKL